MIFKLITVTALSTFEIYAALVAAHGFGMGSWTILICTLIGGLAGTFIAFYFGKKIENYINKKFRDKKESKEKTGLIYTIWKKYGLYGLGLVGTFLFGGPIAIGVGVGFNADLKKLLPICLIAVVVRCFAFTFFSTFLNGLLKHIL